MIYLDNAATTPLDDDVFEAMLPYLKDDFGNPSSQHGYGRSAAAALLCARDSVADSLGCKSDEVYFLSGATEACNTVVKGVCAAMRGRGKHLIVSSIEHPAVLESARDMEKFGFEVSELPCGENGIVDVDLLKKAIRNDTIFCAVMGANNETGAIQPVEEIAEVCASRGIFYFADCVQSACYRSTPLENLSAMAITAHKMYGPKGAGALYIKSGEKISRLLSGGGQERNFRGGTQYVAGAVGLAYALEKTVKNRAEISAKIKAVRDGFLEKVLKEIDGVHVNGENTLEGFANLSFDGCGGDSLLFNLDLNGVAVSRGSACTAGASTPSHVLLAMGLGQARAKSALRFSFGKYNTKEEAFEVAEKLKLAVAAARKC